MYEVSEAFSLQTRRSTQDEKGFEKKEREIKERDVQLQHQLVRFNKFLQDNEAKRKRAEHRAAEELSEIKQKQQDLANLEKTLNTLINTKLSLQTELAQVSSYEEFLRSVIAANPEAFPQIADLVSRYQTLTAAHADLLTGQRRLETQNQQVREQILAVRKERTTQLVALSNEAAGLMAEMEQTEKQRRTLEYDAEAVLLRDADQTAVVGAILRSVDNIFQRVVAQRPTIQHAAELRPGSAGGPGGPAAGATAESVARLACLEAYVRDLKEVAELAKRELKARKPRGSRTDQHAAMLADPEFVKATPADRGIQDRSAAPSVGSETLPAVRASQVR